MASYSKRKPAGKNASAALPRGAENVVQDAEHERLIKYVNEADEQTADSRALSEKCSSYYHSEQWTDAEKTKLKAQKQAATVSNRCKPKVDSLMGMEHANRTSAKAQPRTPKHSAGATAATEAVRFCLQDNMYERHRSDAWENMLVEGSGGIEVMVKAKKDDTYKIVIRQIMWDRLIYDPHSRRKDFSDARYLGQVVWMDYEDALAQYPDAEDVLEAMQAGSGTYDDKPRWMDNARRRCKIVELYYRKENGDWWYACFTRGGYCKNPQKSPYKNEEGETEHPYEFASLFVDREGRRYGSLKQLLDVQDEINKRRSKALHLVSVRQTFGTTGAVADVNKARAELAKPDGHVEFAYGELNKDFGILPTGDMAQAQFNLLTEAKMEMDLVGANSATQGKDKTVQSGVALRQRALTGQTELAPMFDMLKNLDIRVYRKTWNRIKQYWRAEMWLRVTDDENNLKFVGLNKPVTQGEMMLKQAQEQMAAQKVPPQEMQAALAQLQQKIAADPMMKQVVSTENDIVNLDVDIVMDDAPDTVTQEVEDFQAMAEMVKSGFPLPPEAVIMASPLSNKDKILKMMKEQPQVPPEMQKKMEQQGEEMQKLAQENQALKQDQQSEMAKLQVKQQADMQALAHKKELAAVELQMQRERATAEMQLERERAQATIQLEREKAIAQLELEQMKMAVGADGDCDTAIMQIKNLAKQHETQLQGMLQVHDAKQEAKAAAQEKETEVASAEDSQAKMAAMHEQFMQAVGKIVEQLSAKKQISLNGIQRNSDGMLTGASATVN